MNTKFFSFIAFLLVSILTSCSKENSADEIITELTPSDSIVSPPDNIEAMSYCLLDGYENENTIAYLFENGSLLTINPDSTFGYTFQIGKIEENGEWNDQYNITIFTDSLQYPLIVKTSEYYYSFNYLENNKVIIAGYDFNNKKIDEREFSIEKFINKPTTRGSVATTADISLGMVGLIQFLANPTISGYVATLCTAIGWGEALHKNNLEGSSWGLTGALISLIANSASKLNWVTATVSAKVWLDELNKTWSKTWWGENPLFMIDSISTSSTTAIIYYRLDYKGECNNPTADVSYRHNDSSTFFKSTSASKGQNNIKLSGLEPSKQYLARMSACGDGILGMFGQLHTSKYFTTQTPSAITGASDPQRESVNIKCQFKYLPEGAICGIRYNSEYGHNTVSCKSIESEQTITISDLIPITTYKYSTYIEYKGQYWNGQEKSFTTLPPNINGTWTVTEGDGESYTVTFQNGECSWSKEMASPGGYNISTDGKISFSICKQYVPEQWNMYDNANFDGVLDNKKSPSVITGNVLYIHGNWIGAYGEYKKTTFTATR